MGLYWNELHLRPRLLLGAVIALLAASLVYFLQFTSADPATIYAGLLVALFAAGWVLYEYIYRIRGQSMTELYHELRTHLEQDEER